MGRWVSSQVFVFFVIFYSFGLSAQAEELEHLGYPPKGKIFLEMRSEAAVAPLQLLGSVDPPTLLLNGKKLELKDYKGPYSRFPGAGPSLWINGVKRQTTGTIGRFFEALTGAAAAVPKLHVILKSKNGDIQEATAKINRSFLDAPFKVSVELGVDEEVDKAHEFVLGGAIPRGATLEINDGQVSQPGKTTAEVVVQKKLGTSVIAGRLIGEDGTVRVLNIPVRTRKLQFQPGKPVLSIEAPSGNKIYQDWVVPYWGFFVEGLTNPEASLEIAGQSIPVNESTGRFSYYLLPKNVPNLFVQKGPVLPMKVRLPNGSSQNFSKRMLCQNCDIKSSMLSPTFRTKQDWYIGGVFAAASWMAPRDGKEESEYDEYFESNVSAKSQPLSPLIGLRAGWYWRYNLNFEFGLQRYFIKLSGTSRKRVLRAKGVMLGTLDLNWAPTPLLSFGLGLAVLQANLESEHFLTPPDGSNMVIGGGINVQLRFPLKQLASFFEKIEFTPKLGVIPAQLQFMKTKAKWHMFSVEPIALRYYP